MDFSVNPSVNDIQLESQKLVRIEAVCHGNHWNDTNYLLEILEDCEIGRICVFRAPKEVEHQVDSLVVDLIDPPALLLVVKVSLLLDFVHCLMIVHQLHP